MERILSYVQSMLHYPKDSKIPGLLLISEDDAIRSEVLEKIRVHFINRVLKCDLMPDARYRDIYTALERAVNGGFSPPGRRNRVNDRDVLESVRFREYRAVAFDNVHFLFHGPAREQSISMDTIKYVYNQLRMAMIVAGTALLAERFSEHPELMSRFQQRIDL